MTFSGSGILNIVTRIVGAIFASLRSVVLPLIFVFCLCLDVDKTEADGGVWGVEAGLLLRNAEREILGLMRGGAMVL